MSLIKDYSSGVFYIETAIITLFILALLNDYLFVLNL